MEANSKITQQFRERSRLANYKSYSAKAIVIVSLAVKMRENLNFGSE